jgi:hypothetical protein
MSPTREVDLFFENVERIVPTTIPITQNPVKVVKVNIIFPF